MTTNERTDQVLQVGDIVAVTERQHGHLGPSRVKRFTGRVEFINPFRFTAADGRIVSGLMVDVTLAPSYSRIRTFNTYGDSIEVLEPAAPLPPAEPQLEDETSWLGSDEHLAEAEREGWDEYEPPFDDNALGLPVDLLEEDTPGGVEAGSLTNRVWGEAYEPAASHEPGAYWTEEEGWEPGFHTFVGAQPYTFSEESETVVQLTIATRSVVDEKVRRVSIELTREGVEALIEQLRAVIGEPAITYAPGIGGLEHPVDVRDDA